MTEKITYIAYDGEEFDTEEECEAYEKASTEFSGFVGLDSKMVFQDPSVKGAEDAFQDSAFIFITDKDSANDSLRVICDYYGMEVPMNYKDGDICLYDYDEDEWREDVVGDYIKKTQELCVLLNAIHGAVPHDKANVLHETVRKIHRNIADFVTNTTEL